MCIRDRDGQPVERSNLVDLVNDVLRRRRKHSGDKPKGWNVFAATLRRMNVPRELIGHPDRWNAISAEIPSSSLHPTTRGDASGAAASFWDSDLSSGEKRTQSKKSKASRKSKKWLEL